MRGRGRRHLIKFVCVALLSGAWFVGVGGLPAQAASKLDVCEAIPAASLAPIAGHEVRVNLTPFPSVVTKQKAFLGHCEWSSTGSFAGDGTDPPLYLPSVIVVKYTAKQWKSQLKSEKQGGATSTEKIKIAGASKAVLLTADCPPLNFDKVMMRIGKQLVTVQVGAYNISCPDPHAPAFAEVVASNL